MSGWWCCCGPSQPLLCPDWIACLPAQITYPYIEIHYEYWVMHDGVEMYRKENKLILRNMKLVYDSNIGCMNSGGVKNPGTWEFESLVRNKTYPECDYYVQPECPGCLARADCTEITQVGSGTLQPFDVRICCFDPCEPFNPGPSHPTNTMYFELFKNIQQTEVYHGPQFTSLGVDCTNCGGVAETLGPFPASFSYSRRVFGRPECLQTGTFNDRIVDVNWNYFRDDLAFPDLINDWQVGEKLNNTAFYPQGVCDGAYPPYYYCNIKTGTTEYYLDSCNGGPPPTYCTHIDAETCPVTVCVTNWNCWADFYGAGGTIAYECCPDGSSCPQPGCATITYHQRLRSKFTTATIP